MMGEKKNVLLITIDSLRADHVSCLGYQRRTTPNIDNLAQTGVLFTQAIANGPSTPTSFPSLLTSTYPMMYGYQPHLSKYRTTVAEVLVANGYNTAAFHSNPYLSRYYGYDRGFQTFEDFMFSNLGRRRQEIMEGIKKKTTIKRTETPFSPKQMYRSIRRFANRALEFKRPIYPPYENADLINEKAVMWLRQSKTNFFLWIHYMDVHFPYTPPDKFLHKLQIEGIGKSQIKKLRKKMTKELLGNEVQISEKDLQRLIDLYDGEIRYTDDALGALVMELKDRGVYDDTLIIVTADHGDEFNEHGNLGHWPKLYDELIRVPLIIKCPGLEGQLVIDDQVQHLDIAPTILDFVDIESPKSFQGTSLLPQMQGENMEDKGFSGVISEALHNKGLFPGDGKGKTRISYRTVEWKYILDEGNNTEELYDLRNDPKERSNLAEKEPQQAVEFRSRLKKHMHMEKKAKEVVITAERDKVRHQIENLRNVGRV